MDVEINQSSNLNESENNSDPQTSNKVHLDVGNSRSENSFTMLIEQLAKNDKVFCKSQQKDENDLNVDEKIKILTEIFEKSKSNFLSRFGQFLTTDQVKLFEQFQDDATNGYEVTFHLKNIAQTHSDRIRHKHLRNRRYAALKRLVEKDSYFSEIEMMRRNPLLYEQLVGRYLSAAEKRSRDRRAGRPKTFVGVLMDGIEAEKAETKRKLQEQVEDDAMEEEDSDTDSDDDEVEAEPSTSKQQQKEKTSRFFWGEMEEDIPNRIKPPMKDSELSITAQEREILKEEFVSSMYQSFLDGKDDDFDYNSIDNNEEYDNLEIIAHDEEEKYFDSEEPDDTTMEDDAAKTKEESSEDELDIYMNALNQHPTVCKLSEDMEKL